MSRIRLRTGPAALFGAALLVALIALLPMRLALGWAGVGAAGLSARQVRGTVWHGVLSEARVGRLPLGDVRAGLSPWQLLLGRFRLDLGNVGGAPLRGAVTAGHRLQGIDDVTATLPTGSLFAPLPIASLDLIGVTIHFRDGACSEAAGRVRATMAGDLAGLPLGSGLEGAVRCDGGALLVPLTSQGGDEAIALRLRGSGDYFADLTLRPGDPTAASRLAALGFVQVGSGFRLSIQGRLR